MAVFGPFLVRVHSWPYRVKEGVRVLTICPMFLVFLYSSTLLSSFFHLLCYPFVVFFGSFTTNTGQYTQYPQHYTPQHSNSTAQHSLPLPTCVFLTVIWRRTPDRVELRLVSRLFPSHVHTRRRTHILSAHIRTCSCVCTYTHGSSVCPKRFVACVCRWSPSRLLSSHVSPILAVTWRSLRDQSRHHVPVHLLAELSRPKSAGHAQLRTCIEEFGYLAKWPSQMQTQVMSPRSSTRSLSWTMTRCSLTTQTSMKSLASRKTHARTLDCSVFPQCLKPLFRTFLMVILLFREKAKKACLGKPLQDREKERKEKVLWSVLQSRCQGELLLERSTAKEREPCSAE